MISLQCLATYPTAALLAQLSAARSQIFTLLATFMHYVASNVNLPQQSIQCPRCLMQQGWDLATTFPPHCGHSFKHSPDKDVVTFSLLDKALLQIFVSKYAVQRKFRALQFKIYLSLFFFHLPDTNLRVRHLHPDKVTNQVRALQLRHIISSISGVPYIHTYIFLLN